MKTLCTDCWQSNPAKRPTFQTILRQLRTCKIDKDSIDLGLQASDTNYLPRVFSLKRERGDVQTIPDDSLPDGCSYVEGHEVKENGDMVEKKELVVEWDVSIADDVVFGRKLGEGMSAEVFYGTFRGKETAIKRYSFPTPRMRLLLIFTKKRN